VNKALASLIVDGTIERLQRKWLAAHLEELPVLR
jgi:hypothetical protein